MSTASQSTYEQLGLDRFFTSDSFSYDLVAGRNHNASQTRVIYLSEDLLRGVYEGLVEETGPAWATILFNCGKIWGGKLAERLDRELTNAGKPPMGELPISYFQRFVELFFAHHGFGVMRVDLTETSERGIVRIELENSFFSQILTEEKGFVDYLVAGTLETLFSRISGHDLACAEIASERRGDPAGIFVLSGRPRIEALESALESGDQPAEDLLKKLRD